MSANVSGSDLIRALAGVIRENAALLSEIDGAVGDGDHGVNMKKGFDLAESRLEGECSVSEALTLLGRTLIMEIGGAMGPLYGRMFKSMGTAVDGRPDIGPEALATMLDVGVGAVESLGNAKPGDKTILDALIPARDAFRSALRNGSSYPEALAAMANAAERGKESTKEMVANVGRSARLGDRGRGVLDAGATSCWLILNTFAAMLAPDVATN